MFNNNWINMLFPNIEFSFKQPNKWHPTIETEEFPSDGENNPSCNNNIMVYRWTSGWHGWRKRNQKKWRKMKNRRKSRNLKNWRRKINNRKKNKNKNELMLPCELWSDLNFELFPFDFAIFAHFLCTPCTTVHTWSPCVLLACKTCMLDL